MSCRALLPGQPIPSMPGRMITIEEITIMAGRRQRLPPTRRLPCRPARQVMGWRTMRKAEQCVTYRGDHLAAIMSRVA
jgi:hypothetical protein